MSTKIVKVFMIWCVIFFTFGCNKTEINVSKGEGVIIYEGDYYPLNLSTSYTNEISDGWYEHGFIITSTDNGNHLFSFSMKDELPENDIRPGEYRVMLGGDYTARFSLGEGIADSLDGIMKVTLSGDDHVFYFEGSTVDENTEIKRIEFTYTGQIDNK